MSSKNKPVRQDFIAKVRYINNLPPPPVNPKFIKYNTTEKISEQEEADQLLTSSFRKENFKKLIEHIDEENGMDLNLINNPGVLDNGDFSTLIKQSTEEKIILHPNDRALLRDAGIGKITRKEPEVSFLRRTEYIAERSVSRSVGSSESNGKKEEETFDSESQLKAVEKTFDLAQESLQNFKALKHPTKKHLKAVNVWPLLPDTSLMDSKFLNVKFSGSASFKRELDNLKRQQGDDYNLELQKNVLETSVLKPITSNDDEWMSLYQDTNEDEVKDFHDKLNSDQPEKPHIQDVHQYKLKFIRNYDMHFQKYAKPYDELAVKFIEGEDKKRKLAYYYPINGRIDLKKYRASTNTQINKFVKESTYDEVNYNLREPNTSELRKMDNIRSEYDPMEYEGEEEPEAEEASEPKEDVPEEQEPEEQQTTEDSNE